VERRLAAILAADVVSYSRLMEADEAGTLEALKAHRAEFIDSEIANHGGRIVKLMGNGARDRRQDVAKVVPGQLSAFINQGTMAGTSSTQYSPVLSSRRQAGY
jgi:class 3 adenylate cyclase